MATTKQPPKDTYQLTDDERTDLRIIAAKSKEKHVKPFVEATLRKVIKKEAGK